MQEIKAISSDSNHGAPNQHTHTHTHKLILRVAMRAGKKEKQHFVGAKRNRLGVYLFVMLFIGFPILIAHNQ